MSCPASSDRAAWQSLTQPESVALVGASDRNPFAMRLVRNMAQLGFPGELLFVNPQRERVFETTCYPNVEALPSAPDCVAISVPAASVVGVVDAGLRLGVRAFVVNSNGFAEAGAEGQVLQAALEARCRQAGASLIGPNCMGLVNPRARVATFGAPLPLDLMPGPVGVVSQSGSVAAALLNAQRDVGFSIVLSTGNEAVVSAEDAIEQLLADVDTRIVVAFVETLRQPRRFIELARRARSIGRPMVVLKVGTSDRGAHAAFSHTASLAGSARVHAAAFRAAGVMQVFDLDELIETVELLAHVRHWPRGGRTALLGISGGQLALAADIASAVGVELPALDGDGNPLDVGATFTTHGPLDEIIASRVAGLANDPSVDIVAVAQDAQRSLNPEQVPLYRQVANGAARGAARVAKPVVLFTNVSAGLHDDVVDGARAAGLPLLQGARPSLQALRHLGWYGSLPELAPPSYRADPSRFRRVIDQARGHLGEAVATQILAAYAIPITREGVAEGPAAAVALANAIGYPVVLKLVSPDVEHKSDVDGVCLGLTSDDQVQAAYAQIVAAVARHQPSARVAGMLVSEHLEPGVELIVGVQHDPQFGPIVLVGLGGVLVEVLDQVAVGCVPLSADDARALLAAFPGAAVLRGSRGRPPADVEAAVDVLVKVSQLALDSDGVLAELDINPLIVGADGCKVADARLLLAGS